MYVYLEVFAVGMVACHSDWFGRIERKYFNTKLKSVLTSIVLVSVFALSIHNNDLLSRKIFWEYHYIVVPVLNIFLAIFIVFKIPGMRKMFAFIGKYSTVMWLTHIFFRNALNEVLPEGVCVISQNYHRIFMVNEI